MSHAEEGGQLEVMGILQGHIEECCIVVTSVFAIPVSGTETRVNAQAEAYEYMVEHMRLSEMVRPFEIISFIFCHCSWETVKRLSVGTIVILVMAVGCQRLTLTRKA